MVSVSFLVSGTIADFGAEQTAAIEALIASATGVGIKQVVVSVLSGSVKVTVDVVASDEVTEESILAALSSFFASAPALSDFLLKVAENIRCLL